MKRDVDTNPARVRTGLKNRGLPTKEIALPPGMRDLTQEEQIQISGGSAFTFWLGYGLGYITSGFSSVF